VANWGQKIRLKKRYGRLHRALVFSGNRNKAKLLEPTYKEKFCIRVHFPPDLPGPLPSDTSLWRYPPRPRDFPNERYVAYLTRIPVQDTYNLRDVLAKIKNEVRVNRLLSQRYLTEADCLLCDVGSMTGTGMSFRERVG
jgi:hypothetical protein